MQVYPLVLKLLPKDFSVTTWQNIEPYYIELLNREIKNITSLKQWLKDRSELESVLSEDLGKRYIAMTCDTANDEKKNSYNYYIAEIEPNIQAYTNKLNEVLLQCPYANELTDEADLLMIRIVQNQFNIYREDNIPLFTELQQLQVKYGAAIGALTVIIDNEEMTLQKAANQLFVTDRAKRENAYHTIQQKRLSIKPELDNLFMDLVSRRHKVAQNAGFDNYRDYIFAEMCRFDYTPKDCFEFHEAVEKQVVPLLNNMAKKRKEKLGVAQLRPWDLSVDKMGRAPLKPYLDAQDLIQKTKINFARLSPEVAQVIDILQNAGHLDLDSRKGKAPGGYNYPLYASGIPFIFMNSTATVRDLVTMVHEGGHALHSILTSRLELINYKNLTSEIAELASMSMELMSMEHWDVFFENKEDLNRAKGDHMEQIIETLPWVAAIDAFQHSIYENPHYTPLELTKVWNEIHDRFSTNVIDWSGLQQYKDNIWQKQLHLYEVPFYYIEYGIAQLGAIGVWKNYKENSQQALSQYINALSLGYTKSLSAIYETAGVSFDFSVNNIKKLLKFVDDEYNKLD
ncbi:MAG: M3 family oligoendopeptidase [Cytophagales bacterium]|nr:M3 family oligoendopeptidase [Cytophagales bacterium]